MPFLGIKLSIAVESAFKSSIPVELLESKASGLEFQRRQWEREQRPPEPIALATALQKHTRLFITGVPGSGKTTLLRWLAVIFANQQQAEPAHLGPEFTEAIIPIVLELRRFSKRFQTLSENQAAPFDLAHEISAFVGADPRFHGISAEWMHDTLAQKPCLLLIDGLDEIAEPNTRQNVLEALEAFVQIPNYANVRCILTTRPHGFRDVHLSAQFQRTEIQPFTSQEVAQFIHHWYETAYDFDYQAEAEELITAIQAKPRVTDIAQNPLLCTLIAIIYRNNRVLPNRRVELYLKCCEALLDTWERNKKIKESGLIGGFDWQVKLELLMPIAYWFHQQTEQLAMPEEAVVKELAKALEKLRKQSGLQSGDKPIEQEARDFIAAIRDRSGLLQGRGDGTLEFTHRTFQEYLSARYIASQPDPEYIDLVMVHLHKAWWREVHLLVIGHLGSSSDTAKKAERLMLTILNVYKAPSRWLLAPTGKWIQGLNHWSNLPDNNQKQVIAELLLLPLSLKFNLGTQFPRWQWQKRIAWHLMREFELVAQGYADCVVTARTEALTSALSQFAVQRVLKWFKNPFYEKQLSFLLKILKQQMLPRDAVASIFIKALQNNKEKWVRYLAAENLGQLGDNSDKIIEALFYVLQTQEDSLRTVAVESLGQLGRNNDKVINVLLLCLKDKHDWIRSAAAKSLGQLGNNNDKIISALLLSLQDECHQDEDEVRQSAIESLGQLGIQNREVIEALLLALKDHNWRIQYVAANSLGQLGNRDIKVIEALLSIIKDWHGHQDVQLAAAENLTLLGKKYTEVVQAFLLNVESKNSAVRHAAVERLGQLGYKSDEVINALLLALQDKEDHVRYTATKSLGLLGRNSEVGLGKNSDEVVDTLLLSLQDKDYHLRQAVAESLGQLGDNSDKIIEALLLSSQDENEEVRRAALNSLGQLKIEEKTQLQSILIILNRRLHDNDCFIYNARREVFESFRKLLEGRSIPAYSWKPLAKQTFWQRLRKPIVEKFMLILLVGILLVPLNVIIPSVVQLLVLVSVAFTILPSLLFPPKN